MKALGGALAALAALFAVQAFVDAPVVFRVLFGIADAAVLVALFLARTSFPGAWLAMLLATYELLVDVVGPNQEIRLGSADGFVSGALTALILLAFRARVSRSLWNAAGVLLCAAIVFLSFRAAGAPRPPGLAWASLFVEVGRRAVLAAALVFAPSRETAAPLAGGPYRAPPGAPTSDAGEAFALLRRVVVTRALVPVAFVLLFVVSIVGNAEPVYAAAIVVGLLTRVVTGVLLARTAVRLGMTLAARVVGVIGALDLLVGIAFFLQHDKTATVALGALGLAIALGLFLQAVLGHGLARLAGELELARLAQGVARTDVIAGAAALLTVLSIGLDAGPNRTILALLLIPCALLLSITATVMLTGALRDLTQAARARG